MKLISCLTLFFFLLTAGSAANHARAASGLPGEKELSASPHVMVKEEPLPSGPASAAKPVNSNETDAEYQDDLNLKGEDVPAIADPLEPFNRGMYQFNDKLYYWLLKPVAQGYSKVVPEETRVSVKNFFSNLGAPVRFLSCLLQADFRGAATEIGRFGINTIWGIGGLMDPAASRELNLLKQDADLGQTLGVYGVGHGLYIVWPVFGPSSPRDSVGIAGDYLLHPVSYISPWYASTGITACGMVNNTSLRIGDYEALQGAAIDPYVAMRDAYVQYRMKGVKERRAKSLLFKNDDTDNHPADNLSSKQ